MTGGELAGGPALVVGAAIVRGGRVLSARRTGPAELAGRWELPGGKVEPGETPETALLREVDEELGVRITLVRRLGDDWPLPGGRRMRVWSATLVSAAEPRPGPAHDEIRWLAAAALTSVPWLDADLALLPTLATLLSTRRQAPGHQPPLTTGDSA